MSAREEFELLLEKRLAGDVTPGEQARLKTILAQDATLRAEFLIAISQEAALRAIHRKSASESAQMAAANAVQQWQPRNSKAPKASRAGKSPGRIRPQQNLWRAPLAACAVLALGVLLYFVFRDKPNSALTSVAMLKDAGSGTCVIRSGKSIPALSAMDLFANDEIRCPQNGGAKIDYPDATQVALKGSAAVVIAPTGQRGGGKCIRIENGQLSASVSKQPADSPMSFLSAYADAVVLGTRLNMEVDISSTKLSVIEGKVRFASIADGKSLEVSGGEFATAGKGIAFAVARATDKIPAKSARADGVVALYTFHAGSGAIVKDESGSDDPLDLTISDPSAVTWLKTGGLNVHGTTSISTAQPAAKILNACRSSGAITIEAWIKPAQINPDTMRYVLAIHGAHDVHLLELVQHGAENSDWQVCIWTANQSVHHPGAVSKVDGPRAPAAQKLTHLVFTRDAAGNARAFANGIEQDRANVPGDLSIWNEHHFFSIAGDGKSACGSENFILWRSTRAL